MGLATARVLAQEGARVACVDRSADALRQAWAADRRAHPEWRLVDFEADLSTAEGCAGVAERVLAAFSGRLDILVNNAGVSAVVPLDAEDYDDQWDRVMAVNLRAPARLVRAFLPALRAAPAGGRVVNIASTEGLGATLFSSAYSSSKHGVIGLTRALAVELGPQGVAVNCVCPGPIRTGMTAAIPDQAKDTYARRLVPMRRYGEAEEVAHMTVSLCLPASSFTNGAVLVVDGGLLAHNSMFPMRLPWDA